MKRAIRELYHTWKNINLARTIHPFESGYKRMKDLLKPNNLVLNFLFKETAKNRLKNLLIMMFLFMTLSEMFAQEIYLPVTVKNKQAKILYEKAWMAFVNLDFTTSNNLAKQALDIEPDFFMARYITLFNFKAQDDKAIREKLVDYKGRMTKAEKILHQMLVDHQKQPKAPYLPGWEKLVDLYPKNVVVTNFYTHFVLNEENNPQKAKNILLKAIALDPNWPPHYNSLGYVNLALKDYHAAEKAFDTYLELSPEYPNPYDSKGDYYMAVKDYNKAYKSFMKAFEMDQNMSFSKLKASKAKHLYDCERVRPEVEKVSEDFIRAFIDKDLNKFFSYYINDGSFRHIWNGDHNYTLPEVKKIHQNQLKEWESFTFKTSNELLNIINPELAVSYQNFELAAKNKDESEFKLSGNFSLLWQKHENDWKVIQFIETSHETK